MFSEKVKPSESQDVEEDTCKRWTGRAQVRSCPIKQVDQLRFISSFAVIMCVCWPSKAKHLTNIRKKAAVTTDTSGGVEDELTISLGELPWKQLQSKLLLIFNNF